MGINGINQFNTPTTLGATGVQTTENQQRSGAVDNSGNMVVTEMRERVSFALATPELADAMNLTADERQEYLTAAEEKASSANVNLGNKSVMLDIYAVMELIREMSQTLRNAMREMRQCENQAIQQNLKSQAETQRSAAWCQMIGGCVVGGLQAAASAYGTYKQISSINSQLKSGNQLGLDMATEQADLAKAGGNQALANKQLEKVEKSMPQDVVDGTKLSGTDALGERIADSQQKVTACKQDLAKVYEEKFAAQKAFEQKAAPTEAEVKSYNEQMDGFKEQIAEKKSALQSAVDDYNQAVGIEGTEQYKSGKVARDYSATLEADVKEITAAKSELKNLKVERAALQQQRDGGVLVGDKQDADIAIKQLDGEIAEAQKKVDAAQQKLVSDIRGGQLFDSAAEQKALHGAMLADVNGYKQQYDAALEKVNDETRINGSASSEAQAQLTKASQQYKLARAMQVAKSSSFDKISPDQHQALKTELQGQQTVLEARADKSLKQNDAAKSSAYGLFISNLAAALGGAGQKIVEGITQIKQSEITEKQADEKMLEEQLDQIKDLFAQDQSVIQKSIELLQSVISKESQSIEEIINALKA